MKITPKLKRGILVALLCLGAFILLMEGCTSGPVPITLSGYGATATIVIPQQKPKVVPVVSVPAIATPTLLVPSGSTLSDSAVAVSSKGTAATVPVVQAPVSQPTLAVPMK